MGPRSSQCSSSRGQVIGAGAEEAHTKGTENSMPGMFGSGPIMMPCATV